MNTRTTGEEASSNGIPELWKDEDVQSREDGYLMLTAEALELAHLKDDEQQPLLIHSTEILLHALYPNLNRKEDILNHRPIPLVELSEETENQAKEADPENEEGAQEEAPKAAKNKKKKKKKNASAVIPLQFQEYQRLQRCQNLTQSIQSALLDIQHFRHRPIKNRDGMSRQEAKVQALAHQQQRLIESRQASSEGEDVEMAVASASGDEEMSDAQLSDQNGDKEQQKESPEDATRFSREDPVVRLVRTINSIRALYPHLYPILNHKLRTSRDLVIGDVKWAQKKRSAFAWLLGTQVFDISTTKQMKYAYEDATLILTGFIPVEQARTVANDGTGEDTFDYWSTKWIQDVKARAKPQVSDPLTILLQQNDSNIDKSTILSIAQQQDQQLPFDNDGTDRNAQRLRAQYDRAVHKLHRAVSNILRGSRFRDARVSIYGSCLSNLSLGKGADVDLSLWLPEAENLKHKFQEGTIEPEKYEKRMKSLVYQVFHRFNNKENEFREMTPVARARVPVIKGVYALANNPYSEDGSINFDICFLNDIAVANSGLLRQYSIVDPRVRQTMMAVKQWASKHKLNSAADNCISSYAWMNLVIFYLQCIDFLPNLQSGELMKAVGVAADPESNYWHRVNELDTFYLTWKEVEQSGAWSLPAHFTDTPVSVLLYGFFEFYSRRFPSGTFAVSIHQSRIKTLKLASKKVCVFHCIEDPFETFDSHCPHDLSTTTSESGSREIMTLMSNALSNMEEILLGKTSDNSLWPIQRTTETETSSVKKEVKELKKAEESLSKNSLKVSGDRKAGVRNGRNQRGKQRGGRGRGNAGSNSNRGNHHAIQDTRKNTDGQNQRGKPRGGRGARGGRSGRGKPGLGSIKHHETRSGTQESQHGKDPTPSKPNSPSGSKHSQNRKRSVKKQALAKETDISSRS